MGVCGLMDILSDAAITKHKQEIDGEVVAVDLATWICEAEGVKSMQNNVLKPYFRNLIFRVKNLMSSGIKLVFVADGMPPELKRNTINKRLGGRHKNLNFSAPIKRSKLNSKLEECCNLLEKLGMPCIKAEGEAEATCAALNMAGYVDACATSDSDVLLYGATKLYTNLNSKEDSFECYDTSRIKEKLGLNRDDLICLGLLLGCDYTDGVPGIGKISALSWLKLSGNSLESLRKLKSQSRSLKSQVSTDDCPVVKAKLKANKVENKLIEYCKKNPEFPNESVIAEFYKDTLVSEVKVLHRIPQLRAACKYIESKLNWSISRSVERILPMLTYWILNNIDARNTQITPIRIIKTRIQNHVPSYEIEWKLHDMSELGYQSTIEPREIFKQTFPDLVSQFEAKLLENKERKKAEQKKTRKTKSTASNNKMSDYFPQKKSLPRREKDPESPSTSDLTLSSSLSQLTISDFHDEKAQDSSSSIPALPPLTENTCSSFSIMKSHCENEIDLNSSSVIIIEDQSSSVNIDNDRSNSEFSRDMFDQSNNTDVSVSEKENREPRNDLNVANIEPSSPVFMSLAERIRLKK